MPFSSGYCIPSGILNPGLRKSFPSDHATVASPACEIADRIVAAMSEVQWRAKPDTRQNDVGLRHIEQWRADPQSSSFHASLRPCCDSRFKCPDKFWAAVRIPGIIHDISPEIN